MVFSVEINDKGTTSKSLIALIKSLSKSSNEIHIMESIEDDDLLEKMLLAKKSGKVNKKDVIDSINKILAK